MATDDPKTSFSFYLSSELQILVSTSNYLPDISNFNVSWAPKILHELLSNSGLLYVSYPAIMVTIPKPLNKDLTLLPS